MMFLHRRFPFQQSSWGPKSFSLEQASAAADALEHDFWEEIYDAWEV
jgi:hypothetical protein